MSTIQLKPGVRISGEQRAKVRRYVSNRYAQGASIRQISADLGRSYGFVYRLLEEANVQLRKRGGGRH